MCRWLLGVFVGFLPSVVRAQLPDETLELVGLNAAKRIAVLRYAMTSPGEAPTIIKLHRFDLVANKLVETIPIVHEREGHPANARAQVWHAVERRLTAEGYHFRTAEFRTLSPSTRRAGEYVRVRAPSLGADVVLKLSDGAGEGSLVPLDLFVNERLARRDVVRVVVSGGNGLRGLYEVGGVLLGLNLVDETRSGAFSIPLEELRRAVCPTVDAALADVLAQRAMLASGWSLERVGASLELTGPRVERTRCIDGDSAADYTCTSDRAPARFVVRIAPREQFTCPPVFQRQRERPPLPRFESQCFTYVVAPPPGVRYGDSSLGASLDPVLQSVPGVVRSERRCPE